VPVAVAALLDLASVVVFVVLGRRSHDEAETIAGTLKVAAPFLIALVAGWASVRAWRKPADLRIGVVVWAVTVGLGMILRNLLFDRGTAGSFVVVAGVFLALFLLGWRAVAGVVLRRRAAASTPTS
jgi:uncharacterized membrane protein (GlpM family)